MIDGNRRDRETHRESIPLHRCSVIKNNWILTFETNEKGWNCRMSLWFHFYHFLRANHTVRQALPDLIYCDTLSTMNCPFWITINCAPEFHSSDIIFKWNAIHAPFLMQNWWDALFVYCCCFFRLLHHLHDEIDSEGFDVRRHIFCSIDKKLQDSERTGERKRRTELISAWQPDWHWARLYTIPMGAHFYFCRNFMQWVFLGLGLSGSDSPW